MKEISKAYNPQEVEDKIYRKWEESGFFNPDNLKLPDKAEKFSIAMPPPNATGVLHLGHASMLAYEDLMIRYNRMKGKRTLWLPGTDHAAIATQTKVEKIIAKEGKTKYDLGREKFIKRVEEYIENSRSVIKNQTKKMGSSCDWSRERYTLDEGLSRAVREVFVKMHNGGLIYRGDRIVNWCPRCESTLADDEVEHKDQKANLYYFKYQKDFPITIATTRPETKLGDTAVAVNPKDKRYKKYIGQVFEIDLGNGVHKIKIIADREIDMEFGTGALGVTPAHSMADWEMAEKNDLEKIKIIGEDGKMNENAGEDYVGLTVLEARAKFVKYLEKNKLIEKVEEVDQALSVCYRCDTPIEPLPSKQWFVSVSSKFKVQSSKFKGIKKGQEVSLKELALAVVKSGQIKIIPERFKKTYFNWMENLHDWCISRQLWFGHRIPVWYRDESKIKNKESRMKITFIRHCQSEGNSKDIAEGRIDSILTEKGKEQAKEIAKTVKAEKYDAIFSSTLKRAKQTAGIIFDENKIIYDDRLVEIDFGDLTGSKTSEVEKFREVGFSNGEKYTDVVKRVSNFLKEAEGKYQGKHIVIVGHSGIWKALEHIISGKALDLNLLNKHAPLGLIEYEKINSKFKIQNSKFSDEIYVGVESPGGEGWVQDSDTLDTWFSSGLWTFSTLLNQDHEKYKTFEEWVANSLDLKKFHPTSVMETGYDILFFWVARMILMTTYAMGEAPFENVYLHGMVRDKLGRKMSKSLGNGIDPVEMIEKYGTDALRLSMIVGSSPGNDLRIYEEKIEGYRNFVNKLWNISRFIITNHESRIMNHGIDYKNLTLADRWILEHLENLKYTVNNALENYQFSSAFEGDDGIRDFMWDKFADWYLEVSKIQGKNDAVLIYVLETLLKLCHPFIPFVTEQIWQEMGKDKLLMTEGWPKSKGIKLSQVNLNFLTLQEIISGIRKIKNENGIALKEKVEVIINTDALINKDGINSEDKTKTIKQIKNLNKEAVKTIKENKDIIEKLAGTKSLKIAGDIEKPKGWVESYSMVSYYVNVRGSMDKEKEIKRIKKEIENIKKYVSQINTKLNNKQFIANAPANIVKKEKEKLAESEEKLEKLEEKLSNLRTL